MISIFKGEWDQTQYELIDSGEGYKLERFGQNVLIRPEPQALWMQNLSHTEWDQMASAMFTRSGARSDDEGKGQWQIKPQTAEQWWIHREMSVGGTLRMRMGMTSFKHVGVFAEQAANWDFLQTQTQRIVEMYGSSRTLNMFGYTGGASVAVAMAGGEVTHLDAVKQVNTWARENAETSGINSIRYITDDAVEFTARELRRGNQYHGIVLDPPAYGRGPDGQKWVLEDGIYDLLVGCEQLLSAQSESFLLLSLYSMGFSALLAETMLRQIFGEGVEIQCAELCLEDSFGKKLPLGLSIRVIRL